MFAVGMRVIVTKPQNDAPEFMKKGLQGVVKKVLNSGNAQVVFDGRTQNTTAYKDEIRPVEMENE